MHVVDPCFYESGSQDGIYAFFRARRLLAGVIAKPTGQAGGVVKLSGRYRVEWRPCGPSSRYWLQTVT